MKTASIFTAQTTAHSNYPCHRSRAVRPPKDTEEVWNAFEELIKYSNSIKPTCITIQELIKVLCGCSSEDNTGGVILMDGVIRFQKQYASGISLESLLTELFLKTPELIRIYNHVSALSVPVSISLPTRSSDLVIENKKFQDAIDEFRRSLFTNAEQPPIGGLIKLFRSFCGFTRVSFTVGIEEMITPHRLANLETRGMKNGTESITLNEFIIICARLRIYPWEMIMLYEKICTRPASEADLSSGTLMEEKHSDALQNENVQRSKADMIRKSFHEIQSVTAAVCKAEPNAECMVKTTVDPQTDNTAVSFRKKKEIFQEKVKEAAPSSFLLLLKLRMLPETAYQQTIIRFKRWCDADLSGLRTELNEILEYEQCIRGKETT